jgi:hypothetical protein
MLPAHSQCAAGHALFFGLRACNFVLPGRTLSCLRYRIPFCALNLALLHSCFRTPRFSRSYFRAPCFSRSYVFIYIQTGQDSLNLNRKARTGQNSWNRKVGTGQQNRPARTGQPEQDSQNRTVRTGQPEQDARGGQPEWDSRNGTGRGRTCRRGHAEEDRQKRAGRR